MHNGNIRGRKNKGRETIMTKNFPKFMSKTKPQIQQNQRTTSRINAQKTACRRAIFQLQKIKEKKKMLKEARGINTFPMK